MNNRTRYYFMVSTIILAAILLPQIGISSMAKASYQNEISVKNQIFLPLVLMKLGAPSPPVLNDIDNPTGEYTYTVSWSIVNGATSYFLEEDDNSGFSNPDTVYSGANVSTIITSRNIGTYYYRVKAWNPAGSSGWSDVKYTTVTQVVPAYDWILLSSSISASLNTVFFVDQQTGWVAGDDGAIFKTNDGGQSWQPQNSGTTDNLKDMYFLDENRGWIIGGKKLILKTSNGGTSWETQVSPADTYLESIQFADENHGYIAGCHYTLSGSPIKFTAHGYVIRSLDGGTTWSLASRVGITSRCIKDLHFVNGNQGWLASSYVGTYSNGYPDYPRVYVTLDGGDSWVNQPVPVSLGSLNAIHFSDINTGWIVGDSGIVLHTSNGGNLWSQLDSGATGNYEYVQFLNLTEGWIGKPTRHTVDAGATWAPQDIEPICGDLEDIHFINKYQGWALGQAGVVCKYVMQP